MWLWDMIKRLFGGPPESSERRADFQAVTNSYEKLVDRLSTEVTRQGNVISNQGQRIGLLEKQHEDCERHRKSDHKRITQLEEELTNLRDQLNM